MAVGQCGFGVAAAITARVYMNSEGLASDPAPFELWVWTAVCAGSVAVAVLGFREATWLRRGLSLLAIPLTLVCAPWIAQRVHTPVGPYLSQGNVRSLRRSGRAAWILANPPF
ncbi:MAG: hypothetical protein QOI01_3315 [Mycobacterium sp.]|nr:hypothetical protein [Mycobacterium sp.]